MADIIKMIREAYPELSSAKKSAASYFLNHYTSLQFATVTELAERIGVSDTTIINLCSDLGFTGFASFKRAVREELQREKAPVQEVAVTEDNNDTFIRSLVLELTDSITATFNDPANLAALNHGAELMAKAKKIYAVGFWSHTASAMEFCLNLRRTGWDAEAITPSMGDYIDKVLLMDPDDVVIMFNTALYISSMLEIAELLQKQNIPIILITDMGPCPCLPYATVSIHCRGISSSKNYYVASCMFAGHLLRLLANRLNPKPNREYDEKIREGVFSRFNPYGVIEPSKGYTERI